MQATPNLEVLSVPDAQIENLLPRSDIDINKDSADTLNGSKLIKKRKGSQIGLFCKDDIDDIYRGDVGLANIFLNQPESQDMIIRGENKPGLIWDLETCSWNRANRVLMMRFVFNVLKCFLKNVEQNLLDLSNKTDEKDLKQITSILKRLNSSTGPRGVFKQVECTCDYIIPDIDLKMNIQHLSLLDMSHLYPIQGNKILNFRDKTIRDRVRNDLFMFECPVNYIQTNKSKGFPNAIKFFSSICCGDMELVKTHQKLLGYCLTGETSNRNLFIHLGIKGRNGKSTLWKIMAKILDKFLVTRPHSILTDRNNYGRSASRLRDLVGVRVLLLTETSKDQSLNTLTTKKLVKGLNLELQPICKLILTTNNSPKLPVEGDLMYDRVKVIEFNAQFEETLESEIYVNSLLNEHLDEIFSFLVEGAYEYYQSQQPM